MRYVAILKLVDCNNDYDYDKYLPYHITDFVGVTDEEYNLLQKGFRYVSYASSGERRILIEKPEKQADEINLALTQVKEYFRILEDNQKKAEAQKKQRAKKRKQNKLELYEKLKKELNK